VPREGGDAGGGSQHPDDALREIGETGRAVAAGELERILWHVATRGFEPVMQPIYPYAVGVNYGGRTLKVSDELPADEQHYVKHVLWQQEWPVGTTLEQYKQSLIDVIVDPASGLLLNRFQGRFWHLTILRRSGPLQGQGVQDWVVVDYRGGTAAQPGHVKSAYQVQDAPRAVTISLMQRQKRRWLRNEP
jgi:hypothetical protein